VCRTLYMSEEAEMRKIVLVITGALMILGGAAHWGMGLPALHAELAAAHAPERLWDGATAVWLFTSGAMFTFGAMVITAGIQLSKSSGILTPVRWIALFYVIFGISAFLGFHHDLHFLAFIILGLAAGLATMRAGQVSRASA
jgi:hypothetical protein